MNRDCELDLTTDELDLLLETGDEPADLGKAFETMLALALKTGKAVCIFTVTKSEAQDDA